MADDKKTEEVIDSAIAKMNQIKKAAGEFRKDVASIAKDMDVKTEGWRFNVETHEKGVIVDVAIKLLISKKK
jgi:hypothetical protein